MEVGIVESVQNGDINIKDVYFYNRSIQMLKLLSEKPKDMESCRGIWIWGCSGAGKSWKARNDYGEFFLKSQSKWWDGYQGEPVVIIDDMDFDGGDKLGHYLKIWADKYACTGETKGGTIPLNHQKLIVTSNYSIDDIFGADDKATAKMALAKQELIKAIKRRFSVIYLDKPFEPALKPPIAATMKPPIEEEKEPIVDVPDNEPDNEPKFKEPEVRPRVNIFARDVPVNPVHYMAQNNKRVAKLTDKIVQKEKRVAEMIACNQAVPVDKFNDAGSY